MKFHRTISKHIHTLILLGIVLLGIFFRVYQAVERFDFGHDADLFSWIAKDILVNHHLRLIGQLTSAPGIFIGPLFYYATLPFFLITGMDPIGTFWLGVIIGILTIVSYYYVLSKLFNKTAGLIAAFLHAILLVPVNFDRWIVPTLPTFLWAIWYFYSILMIKRGKFSVLPILGILIGLIWHIHIALVPTLLAIPVALIGSKKRPQFLDIVKFFLALLATSLPLTIFEVKHGFSQTKSLLDNFTASHGTETGLAKLIHVLIEASNNIQSLFLSPQSIPQYLWVPFMFLILLVSIILIFKKVFGLKDYAILLSWFIGSILFFSLSKSPISEYYFANTEVIFISLVSLLLALVFKSSRTGKVIILSILAITLVKNLYFFTTTNIYHKGYAEKKALVETISKDVKDHGYPCLAVSYITHPGENAGFRYFLFLKNLHLNHISANIPIYNIVIPEELVQDPSKIKYGHIGLLLPNPIPPKQTIQQNCQSENTNLTDPVLGYTD